VLTHVPPWGDPQVALAEARTTYDGQIDVATSGAVFEV
jgi:ribonuclease BN (tRNA processing enzyme)